MSLSHRSPGSLLALARRNGFEKLCCQKVADMIRGKTAEQIRQEFGIKNDFSPEEEEEIRKENQWAFE